ncbi:MAG: O-antigen ligase family protein [Hyphomicrobiaceae bacterium]|nr:O-antigen ligase family protein [Hyphomicrobiaceae bacterium]
MSAKSLAVPLPIALVIVSFLCPTEFSLYIGGLRLPPHRLALLLLLPIAIAKMVTNRDQRFRIFDVFIILYGAWTIGVYTSHTGRDGFVYGGSLALEALGGYFVARAFVRTTEQLRASLKGVMTGILLAALIALPESLSGRLFTHEFLSQVTGYLHPVSIETRLGLTRAYGTFDHPIHYGTFCAALFALFWYAERRVTSRRFKAGTLGFATFLGLSSAPMLCLGLQGGMLVWDRVTRGIAARGALTVAGIAGLYIGMSLVSNRTPIEFIATGMTLDPWTGFYRLQIWTHGLENVWANPWTGIGLDDWQRPWWMVSDTVDAFWLVITMRQGIPAFILLALAIALLARAVMTRRYRHADRHVRQIALGWMMSLIALSLVGATVHYWNVLHAYYFFFLGLGGWIADPARAQLASFKTGVAVGAVSANGLASKTPEPISPGRPYPARGFGQTSAGGYAGRPYAPA